MHGLWPQNFDGSYPQHCAGGSGRVSGDYSDVYPDAHLMSHELETHGSCSGLKADDYLATVRAAKKEVVIPSQLASVSSELMLSPAEILGDFVAANPWIPRESFALSCGNNRLTAVEVCLGKDLKAVACQRVRTCHANVVRVTPMGS